MRHVRRKPLPERLCNGAEHTMCVLAQLTVIYLEALRQKVSAVSCFAPTSLVAVQTNCPACHACTCAARCHPCESPAPCHGVRSTWDVCIFLTLSCYPESLLALQQTLSRTSRQSGSSMTASRSWRTHLQGCCNELL